jgi:hypothetical protein
MNGAENGWEWDQALPRCRGKMPESLWINKQLILKTAKR